MHRAADRPSAAKGVPGRRARRALLEGEVAARVVALAADAHRAVARKPDPLRREHVDCERACLVRGDHRAGAEALDGRKLAHDHVAPGHPGGSDGQGHRHGDRQTLRDDRDGQGDRDEDRLAQRRSAGELQADDSADEEKRDCAEAAAEPVEALGQGRRGGRGSEGLRDPTEFGAARRSRPLKPRRAPAATVEPAWSMSGGRRAASPPAGPRPRPCRPGATRP